MAKQVRVKPHYRKGKKGKRIKVKGHLRKK